MMRMEYGVLRAGRELCIYIFKDIATAKIENILREPVENKLAQCNKNS
jgi:hypothetical protein